MRKFTKCTNGVELLENVELYYGKLDCKAKACITDEQWDFVVFDQEWKLIWECDGRQFDNSFATYLSGDITFNAKDTVRTVLATIESQLADKFYGFAEIWFRFLDNGERIAYLNIVST